MRRRDNTKKKVQREENVATEAHILDGRFDVARRKRERNKRQQLHFLRLIKCKRRISFTRRIEGFVYHSRRSLSATLTMTNFPPIWKPFTRRVALQACNGDWDIEERPLTTLEESFLFLCTAWASIVVDFSLASVVRTICNFLRFPKRPRSSTLSCSAAMRQIAIERLSSVISFSEWILTNENWSDGQSAWHELPCEVSQTTSNFSRVIRKD